MPLTPNYLRNSISSLAIKAAGLEILAAPSLLVQYDPKSYCPARVRMALVPIMDFLEPVLRTSELVSGALAGRGAQGEMIRLRLQHAADILQGIAHEPRVRDVRKREHIAANKHALTLALAAHAALQQGEESVEIADNPRMTQVHVWNQALVLGSPQQAQDARVFCESFLNAYGHFLSPEQRIRLSNLQDNLQRLLDYYFIKYRSNDEMYEQYKYTDDFRRAKKKFLSISEGYHEGWSDKKGTASSWMEQAADQIGDFANYISRRNKEKKYFEVLLHLVELSQHVLHAERAYLVDYLDGKTRSPADETDRENAYEKYQSALTSLLQQRLRSMVKRGESHLMLGFRDLPSIRKTPGICVQGFMSYKDILRAYGEE